MTEISRDEWLTALREADLAVTDDPAALTTEELRAVFGLGRTATRERLLKLVEMGKAERTSKLVALPDGKRARVTAYRLLK